jgi:hypothetical protein
METNDRILELIRVKGPVIPTNITKEINYDILMTSAHLAELSSQNKLKISNIKVGSSPLYYLPGQESNLQNFSDNLHEKEKKAFDMLKERKVLRDNKLEPVIRVALREIKDFAVQLIVTYQDQKEIFWKWYLVSKEEAEKLTKSILTGKETREDVLKKPEDVIKKTLKEETGIKKPIKQETTLKKEVKKPVESKKFVDRSSSFIDEINSYFNKNNIIVKNSETVKKGETDFILEVPSGIGKLEYYCKVKDKKRINDGDLSSAYVQGQLKKLPVVFLTKGELTKRAKEMLSKEFKNINIINL